tara:strand:- start:228 stop:680 length:453 start_codon:yes stop_codon:yes gene_type:complete
MNKKNFNRNPKGSNQWKLRTDEQIQRIIDSKPRNWTKKDFRGETKLNKIKFLTRKETERPSLKFYHSGKRINMDNIIRHSTKESIEDFKKKKIDIVTLKNRASTKKIRDQMTLKEKKAYDKKIYANLTEKQIEEKRKRQKKWYYKNKNKN